jgi:hypothetical protein
MKFDGISAADAGINTQPAWKTKLTCDQIDKQDYKDAGDDTIRNVGITLRYLGPACCGDKGIICEPSNGTLGALAPMYALMFAAAASSLLSSGMW